MARNQKNFEYFEYLDDSAATWCVRGESGGAGSGVDGHTTDLVNPVFGRNTRVRHVRSCLWRDPVTKRTLRTIIYTPTAYAAIGPGDTILADVEGIATQVSYELVSKIPEKIPVPSSGVHLTNT